MTMFKNDSDAYSVKATYGSIEDQIKAQAQKYTAKHAEQARHQTTEFIETLSPGLYHFQYPQVLPDVVKYTDTLRLIGFDPKTQIATLEKFAPEELI